jgi:Ca-activated chloride channel family protein
MARLLGVKIYAIGIGSEGDAPYPVKGPFGVMSYQRIRSDIDEVTLRLVANVTDGYYFRASRRGELEGIFEHIDELERSEVEVEKHVRYHEFFPLLLRLSALFACLALAGGMTYWRTIP